MSNIIYQSKIKVNCPLIHDEKGYYHLVYKIVNTVNNKIYIGKHSTKEPYDNYFGSGKLINQAIKKYGIENFIKEILYCFIDEKEAFLKEEELVTQEFINRDDTYNMVIGGYLNNGSWSGEKNPMYGRRGEKSPIYGRCPSQETREKISKALKGRHLNQETKDKLSKALKGRHDSKEVRDKKSKSHKGKHIGEKNNMYGMTGEKNPMYGRRGEKSPSAKAILKIDEFGNIITEYGCIIDCRAQENLSRKKFYRIIKNHILYNGFYFEYKSKD